MYIRSALEVIRTAGALLASKVGEVRHVPRAVPSPEEALAVAHYMQAMAGRQRAGWQAALDTNNPALAAEAFTFQAGAAACEAMADMLIAAATGDKYRFKDSLYGFVHGAIAEGLATS